MAARGSAYLVYTLAGEPVELDLSHESGTFKLHGSILPRARCTPRLKPFAAGIVATLAPPTAQTKRPWVAWLNAPVTPQGPAGVARISSP